MCGGHRSLSVVASGFYSSLPQSDIYCLYLKKQRERHASGMRLKGVRVPFHTQRTSEGTFIVKRFN